MRITSPLKTAISIAAPAIWLTACAGSSENGPTILAGAGGTSAGVQKGSVEPKLSALGAEGPTLVPYRGPSSGGVAYRLSLEIEGERAMRRPTDTQAQPPVRETHELEAEFRELPVEGDDSEANVFLVGLDALLYTEKQQNPPADREVEIGDDRLRIVNDNETSIDNRGNRVVGDLAPRLFVNRIFGVISHDPSGNPTKIASRGAPVARDFMNGIPILGAIAYAMIPLPETPIAAGSRWTGVRIPPSRAGELGLGLKIDYTLAGYEMFEKVPCAMILLNARLDEYALMGLLGIQFDRAQATLDGTAWVEVETSRVRRVVMSDQIRASWTDAGDPKTAAEHRVQHTTKLELALRNPKKQSKKWANGTPRFKAH